MKTRSEDAGRKEPEKRRKNEQCIESKERMPPQNPITNEVKHGTMGNIYLVFVQVPSTQFLEA